MMVATQSRKHPYHCIFARANEGNGLKTNIRSLTASLFIHWKTANTQRIITGRIISGHHSKIHFEKSRIWGFDVWLLSFSCCIELRKSICLLRGFNVSCQWTDCCEGASTIVSEDLYILQSTYVWGLAKIVESCSSVQSIGSVTIGTQVSRENIFTSNICLITREC